MNTSLPLYDRYFVQNNLDNHFRLQILERRERNLVTRVSLHLEVERPGYKVSRDRG